MHVKSTAQNGGDDSSQSNPTRTTIENTSNMATRGSTTADVSPPKDVARNDASVHTNKFTNTSKKSHQLSYYYNTTKTMSWMLPREVEMVFN